MLYWMLDKMWVATTLQAELGISKEKVLFCEHHLLHAASAYLCSLGLLYGAFTAFLGFEVNEGEYKVMGMALYDQPRYVDKVWKLVRQNQEGSFLWTWTTSPSTTRQSGLLDGGLVEKSSLP